MFPSYSLLNPVEYLKVDFQIIFIFHEELLLESCYLELFIKLLSYQYLVLKIFFVIEQLF